MATYGLSFVRSQNKKMMARHSSLFFLFFSQLAWGSPLGSQEQDPISPVILWVTCILLFALVGRFLAQRFKQPGVLGELVMGVLLGNICYFLGLKLVIILREGSAIFNILRDMLHDMPLATAVQHSVSNPHYAKEVISTLQDPDGIEFIKVAYVLDVFSRYGVIFLLFMVGLESSLTELKHTGKASLRVALIGVLAPIFLGFCAAFLFLPEASFKANLFVAATLCATSIGITARVLSEMKKLKTREAKTILGAAILDDILGLIILAIVTSLIFGNEMDVTVIFNVIMVTALFFVVALLLGPWILNQAVRYLKFSNGWEAKLFISFIFVMGMAWFATFLHLAAIIGAFTAGMVINDNFFDKTKHSDLNIKDLMVPIEALLAPLFFMLIGIQVKLELFFDWQVLFMASGLIIAAIAGKLLSGLGANRHDDRLLIGMGMLPRGEVGLVFASIGKTLGVFTDQLFSAIILMILVTTFITPPFLKARYARKEQKI